MASMGAELLPRDMVHEILSWLPVSSVLRFRCVCKLWNSVTRQDYFIYSHLERSKSKPKPPQIILHACGFLYLKGKEVLQVQNGFTFLDETWHPKLTLRSRSINNSYRYTRPCNGLICLYDRSVKVRLCNPATREIQILPDVTPVAWMQIYSLGFVARTKEYKVVRLFGLNYHHYEIQVLTVGSASWRRVGDFSSCIVRGEGVHVDGTIYWMVRLDRNSEAYMFSLDLTTEKLELVKLPDSVQSEHGGELICLVPWKGKLASVEIEMPRSSSHKMAVLNVYTLRGHDEKDNVCNRIEFAMREPNPFYTCFSDNLYPFGGLSFVGDEAILAWRSSSIYFHCDSSWCQIYGPDCCDFPRGEVKGLYAFQESLVPLEKSAMLCESKFRPRILPV